MAKRMASKPKKQQGDGADPHGPDGDGFEENGVEFNAEKFLEHVDNVRALKHKGAEIRGKIGAAVKNAEEDYGIHRGAASLWIKLKGMEDEARVAFLKAFDDMRTALGYASQGELFDGANSPADKATFAGR
jgi:hypothetical protein